MRRISFTFIAILIFFIACNTGDVTKMHDVSISISPSASGTISPAADSSYEANQQINLLAQPSERYNFVGWKGDVESSQNPYNLKVENDYRIRAIFEKKQYDLTTNTEGEGIISEKVIKAKSKEYDHGTIVKLTAKPDTGYKFVEWKGDIAKTENPTIITVDNPKEVTASFEKQDYTLLINIDGQGSVLKEPDQASYKYGSEVLLSTSQTKGGWIFNNWSGDTNTNANPLNITISDNTSIKAHFGKFLKTLGGSKKDYPMEITTLSSGHIIVSGLTSSNSGDFQDTNIGRDDIFVLRMAPNGQIEWVKTFGGNSLERGFAMTTNSNDEIFVMGYSNSNDGDFSGINNGGNDVYVLKIDPSGNQLWIKTIGGSRHESGESITMTNDGGIVVSGDTFSNDGDFNGIKSTTDQDIFAAKLSSDGTKEWINTYGGTGSDRGYNVIRTSDSGYLMTGESDSQDGDFNTVYRSDIIALKIDENGNKQWANSFGGSGDEWGIGLTKTGDNAYLIAGFSWSQGGDFKNNGLSDIVALKIDNSGNKVWLKTFGGVGREWANDVAKISDDHFVLMGASTSNEGDFLGQNNGDFDLAVVAINQNGDKLWSKTFGGSESENGLNLTSHNGNYILVGTSHSNDYDFQGTNRGGQDGYILQLNKEGKPTPFSKPLAFP